MRGRKGSAVKARTVIGSIVVCAAVCLSGIGYLWARTEVAQLMQKKKELEGRRDELQRSNHVLQMEYAAMCAPARLDARVKELNLGLAAPSPDQIVRIIEPLPAARESQAKTYAANTND